MARRSGQSGLGRIEVLLVVLVVPAGIFVMLWPAFARERMLDNMTACGDNLRAIGKAMSAYAKEYDGKLPVAGGRETRWGMELRNWSALNRQEAFGLDPNGAGGRATISSSLYLLVRHMGLAPKAFVCRVDRGTQEFRPEKYGLTHGSANLWDFGPIPGIHCSYAYQMVYSPHQRNELEFFEPGFAIAADRNPWIDPPSGKAGEFSEFVPDMSPYGGTWEQAEQGNAIAHKRRGENVLFSDIHVEFEMRPYCGFEDDDIYTSWDGGDKARGVPPKLGSAPADAMDSLLVNDPDVWYATAPRKP